MALAGELRVCVCTAHASVHVCTRLTGMCVCVCKRHNNHERLAPQQHINSHTLTHLQSRWNSRTVCQHPIHRAYTRTQTDILTYTHTSLCRRIHTHTVAHTPGCNPDRRARQTTRDRTDIYIARQLSRIGCTVRTRRHVADQTTRPRPCVRARPMRVSTWNSTDCDMAWALANAAGVRHPG